MNSIQLTVNIEDFGKSIVFTDIDNIKEMTVMEEAVGKKV